MVWWNIHVIAVWSVFPFILQHWNSVDPFIFLSLSYDLKLKLKRSWGLQEGSCFAFLSWSPGRLDIWWSRQYVFTFFSILTEHPAEDDGDKPLFFFLSVAGDSGHPADMLWGQKKGMLPKKQWKRDALQGTMVNNLGFLVKYLQHNTSTFKSLSSWNTTRAIRESSNDTKYLLLKRWLAVGYRHVCSWPIISAWSGLQGGVGSFDLGKQDCHNKFRGPCDLRFRCHWGSDCQGKHWSHRVREEELGRRHVTHAESSFSSTLGWAAKWSGL